MIFAPNQTSALRRLRDAPRPSAESEIKLTLTFCFEVWRNILFQCAQQQQQQQQLHYVAARRTRLE